MEIAKCVLLSRGIAHGDHGNIVGLRSTRRVAVNGIEQASDCLCRGLLRLVAEAFQKTLVAENLSLEIEGLRHTIGV